MLNRIQEALLNQPREPVVSDLSVYQAVIAESIRYLESDEAIQSIDLNPYWPKWDSPWWHMSVLFEMELADRIPRRIAEHMLLAAKRTQLPYFFREDAPQDKTPQQEAPCPCSLGNIYQILCAVGLDVDRELPWARGWFLKYQLPDGGLSCDEEAYRADPNSSSVVGTIALLEAILVAGKKLTKAEELFLDRGAKCLLERELRLGSSSIHNADERLDEEDWLKPCFPRFYFYDVLRGLNFILNWSEKLNRPLPAQAVAGVVETLSKRFPDGRVQTQRYSYEGVSSRFSRQPASLFSLLERVSVLEEHSPFLTAKWQRAVFAIDRLSEKNPGFI